MRAIQTGFVVVGCWFLGVSCARHAGSAPAQSARVDVTVDEPAVGAKLTAYGTSVSGEVHGSLRGELAVTVNGIPAEVDQATRRFRLPSLLLEDGVSELIVVAFDANAAVASLKRRVDNAMPAAAAGQFDARAGSLEVTNASSAIFGAKLSLLDGALAAPRRLRLDRSTVRDGDAPFGLRVVGPALVVGPRGLQLAKQATLRLPYDPARLPAGVKPADLRVVAIADAGPVFLEVVGVGVATVTAALNGFVYEPMVVVAPQPIEKNALSVQTKPLGAQVSIDGLRVRGVTPILIRGLSARAHDVRVWRPGYGERVQRVNVSLAGKALAFDLAPNAAPSPSVTLAPRFRDGLVVAKSLLEVEGGVQLANVPMPNGIVTISLNGSETRTKIKQGRYADFVSLLPGSNILQVRVTAPNGSTGFTAPIRIVKKGASAGGDDEKLTIRLAWNTDGTDVDLHVWDPKGNHAWGNARGGIPGGRIDRDDKDGFGPEIFTMAKPISGLYTVRVHYYDPGSHGATIVTLSIHLGRRELFSQAFQLNKKDDVWNAHRFRVHVVSIVKVETHKDSPSTAATFTTAPGENRIRVAVRVPKGLAESNVRYRVRELSTGLRLDTSGIFGRSVEFLAQNAPLASLTKPRLSRPLRFEIVAFVLDKNGKPDLFSPPFYLTQDSVSQIRQEYIDKRRIQSAFQIPTPAQATIRDRSSFTQEERIGFDELSIDSDYRGRFVVVGAAIDATKMLRDAWGAPLRVAAGWRNPRASDAWFLTRKRPVELNSAHQSGDAVELRVALSPKNWPVGIESYVEASNELYAKARELFRAPWKVAPLEAGPVPTVRVTK